MSIIKKAGAFAASIAARICEWHRNAEEEGLHVSNEDMRSLHIRNLQQIISTSERCAHEARLAGRFFIARCEEENAAIAREQLFLEINKNPS